MVSLSYCFLRLIKHLSAKVGDQKFNFLLVDTQGPSTAGKIQHWYFSITGLQKDSPV